MQVLHFFCLSVYVEVPPGRVIPRYEPENIPRLTITRKDVTHIVPNQIDSISRAVTVEGMKLGTGLSPPVF